MKEGGLRDSRTLRMGTWGWDGVRFAGTVGAWVEGVVEGLAGRFVLCDFAGGVGCLASRL